MYYRLIANAQRKDFFTYREMQIELQRKYHSFNIKNTNTPEVFQKICQEIKIKPPAKLTLNWLLSTFANAILDQVEQIFKQKYHISYTFGLSHGNLYNIYNPTILTMSKIFQPVSNAMENLSAKGSYLVRMTYKKAPSNIFLPAKNIDPLTFFIYSRFMGDTIKNIPRLNIQTQSINSAPIEFNEFICFSTPSGLQIHDNIDQRLEKNLMALGAFWDMCNQYLSTLQLNKLSEEINFICRYVFFNMSSIYFTGFVLMVSK